MPRSVISPSWTATITERPVGPLVGSLGHDVTVSVVGLTEYQGATKALFADEFVWAYDFCQPEHFENVNPNHPLQKDFSCDVINSTKRAFGDD